MLCNTRTHTRTHTSSLCQVGSKGIPRSPADAIPPLVASCEAGEVLSCKNLSVLYKGADVIPADPDKVKYYRSRLADHIEAQTGKKLDRD